MYADLGSGEPTASINPNPFMPLFFICSDLQEVDGIRVKQVIKLSYCLHI